MGPEHFIIEIKTELNMNEKVPFFNYVDQLLPIIVHLPTPKEYKEEAQCAQKGGRMLFFVICGFIENCFLNFYFILQIYHVKSFKVIRVTSLYFNFSVRYS